MHLLGDQLISDEVMAAVELVKNAYDADARQVIVVLDGLSRKRSASIEVRDDGDGMDLDTVLHVWFEPATHRKMRTRRRKARTALGRYPLGEKGVGRFAADKLGSRMELVTRARGTTQEVHLHVRWESYGGNGYLDEIENRWEVGEPRVFLGESHGTVVRISGLRTRWDAARVARLRDGLSRLVSPFSAMLDFGIALLCPEFPDHSGPVIDDLIDHAPHRLVGRVDAHGLLHVEQPAADLVNLVPLASESFREGANMRRPECGPFHVALFVWDLDAVGHRGTRINSDRRQSLRRRNGVSLYRDGFRVWPYGEPGNDWLELNQRRVNNPTMRVSTNQIMGFVEITQEHSPELQDRTSREGLVDSTALHDLRTLVLGAISHLEQRRFLARKAEIAQAADDLETDPLLQTLNQLRVRSHHGTPTLQLLNQIASLHRQHMKDSRAREDRLMRLASVGLAAEHISSEIGRTLGITSGLLCASRNRAHRFALPEQMTRDYEQLDGHLSLLGEQLDALEAILGGSEGHGDELLDVRSVVEDAATVFTYRLRQGGVRLVIEPSADITVCMRRPHLMQVLLHLFDNALHWLAHEALDRTPEVRVRLLSDPPGFLFADNGPGVRPETLEHVFKPFFTGRSDGRGLGLHIVKTIADSYGFTVDMLEEPQLLAGANFRMLFAHPASGAGTKSRVRRRNGGRPQHSDG
jgi:C4-dicarboxylate-specific signal transduction histidine kinase